jgi:hypothetical protein
VRENFYCGKKSGLEKIVKVKLQFLFTLLLACVAAGCFTNKERIVFSDESTTRQAGTNAVGLPQLKKLEKQDEFKIDFAVYNYLLQRHFWDNGEYSAVFLQGEDAEVDALIKKFPNHVPPIKTSNRAELPSNRAPVDKDTGKPAMILSVDIAEPDADDSVDAIGRWFAGETVAGFYTFELKKTGDEWEIENVK